jgi:nitrilase
MPQKAAIRSTSMRIILPSKRLEELASEAARHGAELVVFPETFVPVYPSSRWAKAFAAWQSDDAKTTFARIAQNSIAVGSPEEHRLAAAAKELGI